MKMEYLVLNEERHVSLTAYLQPVGGEFAGLSQRPAVLIIPGGGYHFCSDREADPVAFPYLKAGYHAFILRYSLNEQAVWPNPLSDYEQAMELVAQSNRIMQMLDERREPPYKTFDYIGRSADMLVRWKGAAYVPRITRLALRDGFGLLCVEPPCGSNTYVYHKDGALLLIDGGFPCYAPELTEVLRREIPGFDGMRKQMLLTHPDTDHCGLMEACEAIWVSPVGWQHFDFENRGLPNFREQNPVHAPYVRIHQILSRYRPPRMAQLRRVDEVPDVPERPLSLVGGVDFCGRRLAVYRGNGGHAPGEVAIVDETDRLVFSGDILVNPEGFIPAQAEFNRLAPYLMTSVNMDSRKAGQERAYLKKLFSPAEYRYCPGHGAIMELK